MCIYLGEGGETIGRLECFGIIKVEIAQRHTRRNIGSAHIEHAHLQLLFEKPPPPCPSNIVWTNTSCSDHFFGDLTDSVLHSVQDFRTEVLG